MSNVSKDEKSSEKKLASCEWCGKEYLTIVTRTKEFCCSSRCFLGVYYMQWARIWAISVLILGICFIAVALDITGNIPFFMYELLVTFVLISSMLVGVVLFVISPCITLTGILINKGIILKVDRKTPE